MVNSVPLLSSDFTVIVPLCFSIMLLLNDSISYYLSINNIYKIKEELARFGRYKRTKVKSKFITIPPFDTIPLNPINKNITFYLNLIARLIMLITMSLAGINN